ncbi:hypothetical protein GO730_00340 [Spirosoma sp. HMF3257]|uniref:Uncharacterized protein n=1 Tax=Spirosoma telluris TaxID=2183553 RepID=A0A327NDA7_9BACT|nr:hypothetical protein [Spirosoma telluris]RAI73251.1 hypothetical protein HMF3257_00325 [Spirosoma telluris]
MRWELKNIDVRWHEVELAVLYYETEGLPLSITGLKPVSTGGAYLDPTSITLEISQLDGQELTLSDLTQVYDPVLKVGTLAANQNRLFEANLTRLKPFGVDSSAVSYSPVLKSMLADVTREPTFTAVDNPVSHRKDNDPLTNTYVDSGIITRKTFGSQQETYSVTDDYFNDKGQVWEWLHGSYFRGETAEYACVLFDRLGQPMFAYPLPAFTFPEQFTPGPAGEKDYYTLTKLNTVSGLYELRMMGVAVSGIRIPEADLYDADGRLNVSGFSIVRRKRLPRLLHQGVVFPVCRTEGLRPEDDCAENTGRAYKPFALPYLNYFGDEFIRRNRHLYPLPTPAARLMITSGGPLTASPIISTIIRRTYSLKGVLKPLSRGMC